MHKFLTLYNSFFMKNIQKRKRKNNISYQLFITRYSNFKIIFFWLMGFWSFSGYTQEQDTVILRVKPYHDTVLVTDAQVVVHSGEKDSLILQYSEEEGAYIGEAVVKLLKYRSGRY